MKSLKKIAKDTYLDARIFAKKNIYAPTPWLADDEHKDCNGCGECACLTIFSDDEIERIADRSRATLAMMDGAPEYNVIVDVVCLHEGNFGKIDFARAEASIHSLHDAFRNRGHNYHPEGTDTGINFSMGEFLAVDMLQDPDWAEQWASKGVRLEGTVGMPSSMIFQYAREKLGNYGANNRIVVVSYSKATPGNVAGFAYLAQNPAGRLSGAAVRHAWIGDRRYAKPGQDTTGWTNNAMTLIHEFGHALGLFHTFHNTPSCEPEIDPLRQGDRIADTPQHMQSNFCGYTDRTKLPHISHMSYNFQRLLFSAGQAERMQAVALNIWLAMTNNPRVYWPDEIEQPEPPVEPPIPPVEPPIEPPTTPPVTKPKIKDFSYEIIDAETKTIQITATIERASEIELIAWSETDEDDIFTKKIDYGNKPEGLICDLDLANVKGGELTCPVSGLKLSGTGYAYEDADGKGILFGVNSGSMMTLEGLSHQDYTYRIKAKFTEKIGNVQSIISKRIHHNNNESFFFLFTFTGNSLHWDNTTNLNRRNTNYIPKLGEMMDIIVSRGGGMWINGEKVADAGSVLSNLVNNAPLRIGNDHTTSGRGMGGAVYSVEVYDRSYTLKDFND